MFKKILMFVMMFGMVCSLAAQISPADDHARQAIYGALDQAKPAIAKAPFAGKTVAILPIAGDDKALITGRLKNMLTAAKVNCVEGKEDPMWNEIMKEIAWDQRKDDILDAKTIVAFGKLKAAQVILYGKIRALDKNDHRIYAEIELHATDITTKQHIWGGSFAYRFYLGSDMRGIITLDNDLRLLLKKNFEEAKKTLLEPTTVAKFNKGKTVTAIIPLSGDIDEYMTGLATEMLTNTVLLPKRSSDIPSVSQARAAVRDGQLKADLVFYGAIRDLYSGPITEKLQITEKNEPYVLQSNDIYADIQLFVEDVNSGVTLWAKTITLHEIVQKTRDLNAEEMKDWIANEEKRIAEIKAEQERLKKEAEKKKAEAEKKKAREKAIAAKKAAEAAEAAKEEQERQASRARAAQRKAEREARVKFYAILIASVIGGLAILGFIIWCIKARASYRDVR